MNPQTTTRRDFTASLLSHTIPADADAKYKNLASALRKVLELLINHDAMKPNIDQTYATPANSKNKVYFMWDFIGRTLAMLYSLSPTLPSAIAPQWDEITGRAMYARELITDQAGQLDTMMDISYGDGSGVDKAEFGDEVLEAARGIMGSE